MLPSADGQGKGDKPLAQTQGLGKPLSMSLALQVGADLCRIFDAGRKALHIVGARILRQILLEGNALRKRLQLHSC